MSRLYRHRYAAAVIVAAAALSFVLSDVVLQHLPDSSDEFAYLYQAKTFLAGRVHNPPQPVPQAFTPVHIIGTLEATYSKYPPGWPAILTLGVLLGAPHAVNAVLLAALLTLIYVFACRLRDEKTALVLLLLLASNAYFVLSAAQLLSHVSASVAFFLCLWGVWRYGEERRARQAVLAGFALGALALIRPQDALGLSIGLLPLLVVIARGAPWRGILKDALFATIPFLACLIIYGLYNQATNGDPLKFGHTVYQSDDTFRWDLVGALKQIPWRLAEYAWITPIAVLAPWGYRKLRDEPGTRRLASFLLWLVVSFWVTFSFYLEKDFPPRFGPRYVYPVHPLVTALATVALVDGLGIKRRRAVIGTVVALQLIYLAVVAADVRTAIAAQRGVLQVRDELEQTLGTERAYIWIDGPVAGAPPWDMAQNNFAIDDQVLLFSFPSVGRIRHLLDPERLLYVWDGLGGVPVVFAEMQTAPVQWLALDEETPLVLDATRTRTGWLASMGRGGCMREPPAYPGRRPGEWSARGPCGWGDRATVVAEPGFEELEGTMKPGAKYYAIFRTYFLVNEPVTLYFDIRTDAQCAMGSGGRYTFIRPSRLQYKAPPLKLTFTAPGRIPLSISCEGIESGSLFSMSVRDELGVAAPPEKFMLTLAPPEEGEEDGSEAPKP